MVRIDPTTGKQVASIQVGNGPTGIAYGHGSAWVTNSLDETVSRINPDTNSVTATVPTGNGPDAVALDAGGVWVSNEFDGNVVRIDPSKNQVTRRVSVGSRPLGLATSGDAVLVAVRHLGADHRGGTLVLRSERLKHGGSAIDSIDTAITGYTYTLPFLQMTGDGLTAFNQVSGLAGAQVVPDLATSLPTPTDGGRTYTFRLRSGIRYSNGKPVQATDFRPTFERDFALKMNYDENIVGGAQCRKHPKRCDLSRGIVADNAAHTVTFHLVQPDPSFLYELASSFAYVLPAGTPRRPARTHGLPATGPYMIATYRPNKAAQARPQPVLPRVVAGRAACRVPRQNRAPHRRHAGRCDSRRRRRQGRRPVAGPADHAEAGLEARGSVRQPDALRPAAEPPGALPQYPRPAVQPARRPQGGQLRRRPRRRDVRVGRAEPRRADVPDPAAELPRASAVLPLHVRLDEARQVVGARPGDGKGARRTFGDSRHEGHRLGMEPGEGLQPGGREGAALARLPRDSETGSRRRILG